MARNIPEFSKLPQGDGYVGVSPGPDTLESGLGDSTIPGLPDTTSNTIPTPDSPLTPSLAGFETSDAPVLGQTWASGDKGTNWMGNDSYPKSNTGTEPVK